MKTFGLVVPKGGGRIFAANVRPSAIAYRDCSALTAVLCKQDRRSRQLQKRACRRRLYTARSYQSGEIDYDRHLSKRGDTHVRSLLYEAAAIVLTRVRSAGVLRPWDLKLKERVGFKRAAVAVARKLAVILHAICMRHACDGAGWLGPMIISA